MAPLIPVILTAGAIVWIASRGKPKHKRRRTTPDIVIDPKPDPDPDPPPDPERQGYPGILYGGSNPGPWDPFGMSKSFPVVAASAEVEPDGSATGWAVYEHANGNALIGVIRIVTSSGESNGILKGPFQDEDEAVSATVAAYEAKLDSVG